MLAALGLLSAAVAGICWMTWAFGVPGEYPARVLGVAIIATILSAVCAVFSKITDESMW